MGNTLLPMYNITKRLNKKVAESINQSLYSKDVKASIYTAYLLNYRNQILPLQESLIALEYDIVEDGLFIGGIANHTTMHQILTINDLAKAFYERYIGGDATPDYIDMFTLFYKHAYTHI